MVFPYTSTRWSSFPFPSPCEPRFLEHEFFKVWEGTGREGTCNLVRCNYSITRASVYTNYRAYRKLQKLIPV